MRIFRFTFTVHHTPFTIYDSPFTIHEEINLLTYILYTLFILSCVVLVVVVLLQPGKSGAGELFSSNISSTAFGPRGTASVLAKITIGAASAFMLIALMLSLPVVTGQRSVLQSTDPEAPSPTVEASPSPTAEASPAASPAASATPAASPQK
ncbi:MAG: preprotein translocase subunit SecG [Pyrinomonadaceae bacterium]